MGWANCGQVNGRPVGYAVAATCDEPGCEEKIDRGLGCICGVMHGDNCGGYFCGKHLFVNWAGAGFVCERCRLLNLEGEHEEDLE